MKDSFFTTGEFAKRANVSVRTIRYYDKQGLLKPSHTSGNGYRLYTEADFARLQKILTLKYLGFSLDEILDLTLREKSSDYVRHSLQMQLKIVQNQIENLELVRDSLRESERMLENGADVDWKRMLQLIHMVNMEKTLAEQYKNSENIDIRIRLHRDYSANPEGWFCWLYDRLALGGGMAVLEIGCGNGELWSVNAGRLPEQLQLCLSDSSAGMVADAKEKLRLSLAAQTEQNSGSGWRSLKLEFAVFDCQSIPRQAQTYDRVLANHMLFYVKNREAAYREAGRVLRRDGCFVCSTYGSRHMREMTELVKEFDERINLSRIALYEVFGLENAQAELEEYFGSVERLDYQDYLELDTAEPLVDYILSCHGNQREFLNDRLGEFYSFIEAKLAEQKKIRITKQAGIFICKKPKNISDAN